MLCLSYTCGSTFLSLIPQFSKGEGSVIIAEPSRLYSSGTDYNCPHGDARLTSVVGETVWIQSIRMQHYPSAKLPHTDQNHPYHSEVSCSLSDPR